MHCQIAAYLNMVIKKPSRWHTVEVSNHGYGKAAMINQAMDKKKGVITGWPDITIYRVVPMYGYDITLIDIIFLEVKVPGGKLTEKQEELHKELREEGHSVYVVYSVDDVKRVLIELGVI